MNDQTLDWPRLYPDIFEELDKDFPAPRGTPLDSAVYFDSNWAHNEVMRRSISGIISFIGILQYLGFADDKGQSQLALIQQNYVQQKLVPKRQFPCIDNCQVLGH